MAAATADRDGQKTEGKVKSLDVKAAVTLFKNTLAGWNAGYLQPLAHGTSGLRFAGVTQHKADNADGDDGDIECKIERHGEWEFVYNGGNADETLLGKTAYAIDDQTVDEDPSTVTNEYAVGEIVEIVSATKVRIQIDGYCLRAAPAAQAAISSLTDNTGGAADNTLANLADGTTYANDHAAIENNFADVGAKVNSILTALRGAGIIAS